MQPDRQARSKVKRSVVWFAAALLGLVTLRSVAQGPPLSQGGDLVASGNNRSNEDSNADYIAPSLGIITSGVQFRFDDVEARYAGIGPQAATDQHRIPGLRFAEPLLALVEREVPKEPGLPTVVEDISRETDGVWLRFRVMRSTPAYLRHCRDEVLAKERPLLKQEHLTEQDVDVRPWPLKHCVVTAKHPTAPRIYGVGQSESLSRTLEEFTFRIRFDPSELDEVLGLIHAGELRFVYSYSYVGRQEHSGKVDLKGVKNAKLLASQKLQSKQEGTPIFQAEANEAARHVLLSVERTTRSNHPDLLPLLDQPSHFDTVFQQLFTKDGVINLAELKEGQDAATVEMVADYLKPHLEQIRESLGEDKKYVTIKDERKGTATTESAPSVGLSIAVPLGPVIPSLSFGFPLGDDVTKTEEFLKRVEKATGTTWVKETNSETYRPHSIKKFKFQDGSDHVVIDDSNTVFLAVGRQAGYHDGTTVLASFTARVAAEVLGSATAGDLGPYQGVPIGTMLPFFGTTLPKGYVWGDEPDPAKRAYFPNAAWVLQHLRGTQVPDMRDYLIGGTSDVNKVGTPFNEGKLVIEKHDVPASAFKLGAGTVVKRIQGQNTRPGYGLQNAWAFVVRNEDGFDAIKRDLAACQYDVNTSNHDGYYAWFQPVPANYQVPDGALTGTHTIPGQVLTLDTASASSRHVRCRWILRVE